MTKLPAGYSVEDIENSGIMYTICMMGENVNQMAIVFLGTESTSQPITTIPAQLLQEQGPR